MRSAAPAAVIGVWAALVALVPDPFLALALGSPIIVLPALWWLLRRSTHWVAGLFGAALLLPPLPIAIGNSGPHPALLLAAAGGWVGTLRLREWQVRKDPVGVAMLVFLALLMASLGPAAFYSGSQLAMASLARGLLFAISVYVYLFTVHGPGAGEPIPATRAIRWLLAAGFLAAAFACLDFYFQFPAPAGYGAQYVWLDVGVLRRAQGLFYEASTLGNFCTFLLVMIAVTVAQGLPVSRFALLVTGALLSAALVFSYSRASILALLCALGALYRLRSGEVQPRRWMLLLPVALIAGGGFVYVVFPEFAQSYFLRARASFQFFFDEPNRVLSGRLASWSTVGTVLLDNPHYLALGIGYKTLPYSDLAGGPVVADNMYLSLLMETGLPGLTAFLWLNFQILRMAYRAARRASVFGIWIFCFWIGEMVQMLSGDLFTYWRVLPLYFWVLARAGQDE